jgi:hypothetical protein
MRRASQGHLPLVHVGSFGRVLQRVHCASALVGAEGALPVMQEVRDEARRRKVDLVILPTAEAIGELGNATKDTNAVLHLTC